MKINIRLPLINTNKGEKQLFNIEQSTHIFIPFMQHFLTLECLCNKLDRFFNIIHFPSTILYLQ
jgi:hypothetical protein